jgi:hypothetical protein
VIDFEEPGNEAWTYAHWDAALLGNLQSAAKDRLGILRVKHPKSGVKMEPAFLAGLPAFRIRISYADSEPITEEVLIAYRKPEDKGPGRIYEIGLKCGKERHSKYVKVFEALVKTFQITAGGPGLGSKTDRWWPTSARSWRMWDELK